MAEYLAPSHKMVDGLSDLPAFQATDDFSPKHKQPQNSHCSSTYWIGTSRPVTHVNQISVFPKTIFGWSLWVFESFFRPGVFKLWPSSCCGTARPMKHCKTDMTPRSMMGLEVPQQLESPDLGDLKNKVTKERLSVGNLRWKFLLDAYLWGISNACNKQ